MVLPDILEPDQKVVFCGLAVGNVSARRRAYYAHPGNRFWWVLHQVGLTPRQLRPEEYAILLDFGIGLTDIVKEVSGRDVDIAEKVMTSSQGRLALHGKIERFGPKTLAFNGKKAAKAFSGMAHVSYGRQPWRLGSTEIFVLPSTSGAARGYWDIIHWKQLADAVGRWSEPSSAS